MRHTGGVQAFQQVRDQVFSFENLAPVSWSYWDGETWVDATAPPEQRRRRLAAVCEGTLEDSCNGMAGLCASGTICEYDTATRECRPSTVECEGDVSIQEVCHGHLFMLLA